MKQINLCVELVIESQREKLLQMISKQSTLKTHIPVTVCGLYFILTQASCKKKKKK